MNDPQDSTGNLVGITLGNYILLEEIGRGGMATVYRAQQTTINRVVAIKVLPPYFLHQSGLYERFEREVEVVARLEHPHILPIYDYGKAGDIPYIVMRLLAGGSMAQIAQTGVKSLNMLEKPLNQVALALDYAHEHGVIHRDIKPGNIMLDEGGNAYLSDFGVAKVTNSQITGTNHLVGTPAYMSPEQIKGLPADRACDIYALGVVLFELITGHLPFEADNLPTMMLMHINEPVPSAFDYRNDVPASLDSLLSRTMAKDPTVRYSRAAEVAQEFRKALRPETHPSRPAVFVSGRQKSSSVFTDTMTLRMQIEGYDENPIVVHFSRQCLSVVIGRMDDPAFPVDVDLNDYDGYEHGVSRRHAVINLNIQDRSLEISDLDSSNGTYLNSEKLVAWEHRQLHDGDKLRLSRLVMHVYFDE